MATMLNQQILLVALIKNVKGKIMKPRKLEVGK
jgi:hypothetical protein